MMRNKGYTSIEVMIVGAIFAILLAIAMPIMTAEKAQKEKQKTERVIEKKEKEDSDETMKDI